MTDRWEPAGSFQAIDTAGNAHIVNVQRKYVEANPQTADDPKWVPTDEIRFKTHTGDEVIQIDRRHYQIVNRWGRRELVSNDPAAP